MAIAVAKVTGLIGKVQNGGFVTVAKRSEAKLKKRGNPLRDANVEKVSRFQIQVGCDLQRIESNRAAKEGREARTIGPLPWGEYVEGGLPLIRHNNSLYLRGFWVKSLNSDYLVDGRPATSEEVETIKQFTSGKPLDRTAPMTVKLDHITHLSGAGETLDS